MTRINIYEALENAINAGRVLDLTDNNAEFFVDDALTEIVDVNHENTADEIAVGATVVRTADDEIKVMVTREGSHFEDYYFFEEFVQAYGTPFEKFVQPYDDSFKEIAEI